MAVTLATFRLRYPQFNGEPDAWVQYRLDDGELDISSAVFGADYDRAVYLYAAARLFSEPYARDLGIARPDNPNPYASELTTLRIRKGNTNR